MSATPRRPLILTLLILATAATSAVAQPAAPDATLANLQVAHSNELNSRDRYLAFAARAQEEGHGGAAALFRATAAAENVHAAAMARVLRGLGAEPSHRPAKFRVAGTIENLRRATADEVYDRETMYAEFLAVAQAAGLREVALALTCVAGVEEGHAALLEQAARDLENGIEPAGRYRVCSGCGFTQEAQAAHACGFCPGGHEEFLVVE